MTTSTKNKDTLDMIACIKSLAEDDDITVKLSKTKNRITISHRRTHVTKVQLVWSRDHFIGYILDDDDNKSQAVLALWSLLEAAEFTSWYLTLVRLAARRM